MSGEYYYLGLWNSQGVPNYLTSQNDVIDPDYIQRIRQSLPEYQPVPTYHPEYLTNTAPRNIIISTNNAGFNGADVFVTFVDEGAGYKNVLGYYTYPLNGGYTVPTKQVNGSWVPMTYGDRDSLDVNGKSILKKTIIFPNSSLIGKGGGLKPGYRVKLLYDTSNPSTKFPNNTGIGFFLIPNGYNSNTNQISNVNARVYTDAIFNNVTAGSDSIQAVVLNDTMHDDFDESGALVLGFEDIMRPAGDKDFNDLIIKIKFTPSYCFDRSNSLILSLNDNETTSSKTVADKTGLYMSLPQATVTSLLNVNFDNIRFEHTIKTESNQYCEWLKVIFDNLVLENSGYVDYSDEDFDEQGRHTGIKCVYKILRSNAKKYIYFVLSANNREIMSILDPNVRNIVNFQDYYITGGSRIISENVKIKDDDHPTNSPVVTVSGKPDLTNQTPYAMGDPHITTLDGRRYTIPNILGRFTMFDDGDLKIFTDLDYYPENEGHKLYSPLTFMRNLIIECGSSGSNFELDMFSTVIPTLPDDFEVVPQCEYITNQKIMKYISEFEKAFGKNADPVFRFIKTTTTHMGETIIATTFAPKVRDYINGMSIISNGLAMTRAKGALVKPPQML